MIKQIFIGDTHFNNLYYHQIPLNEIFTNIRKINLNEEYKKNEGEFYLSLKGESNRNSYYVTITDSFKKWIKNDMLSECGLYFEIIQQQTHKPKAYLNKWLVLLSYSQILGSRWLDYKTTEEIRDLFPEEDNR